MIDRKRFTTAGSLLLTVARLPLLEKAADAAGCFSIGALSSKKKAGFKSGYASKIYTAS